MDPTAASSPAEELDRLERELAVGLEKVAELKKEARVLEVETGNWVRPPQTGGIRMSLLIVGIAGFWLGTYGVPYVVALIGLVLR
jgi:hypothetical protein